MSDVSEPQILVTGRHFTGHGLRAIGPVLEELTMSAQHEIHVLAYLLTESAGTLLGHLERRLETGIKVTLVVNRLEAHQASVQLRLQRLARQFPQARIFSFEDSDGSQLHAKVLVADRFRAVIGSANFTWGGMVANHEVGVLVEGGPAWNLGDFVDRLTLQLRPIPAERAEHEI
jgi:phosphatidylserine/phosphatidylglycerophosphate/cardiolipin synthase-like enzyme